MKIFVSIAYCEQCQSLRTLFAQTEFISNFFECPYCHAWLRSFYERAFVFFISEEDEFAQAQEESMESFTPEPAAVLKDTRECLETLPPEILPEEICSICLEKGADVKVNVCGHKFHAECIKKWLTECKATCPVCNANLIK